MRFGPDEKDDFYDLASIPSSDLRLCAIMHILHAAVAFNRIASARTLMAAGADAGHYNWRGQTPLFTSASIGHVPLVRLCCTSTMPASTTQQ